MFRRRWKRQESGGHGAGTLEKKTETRRKAEDTPTQTAQQKPIPMTGDPNQWRGRRPAQAPTTLGEQRGPFSWLQTGRRKSNVLGVACSPLWIADSPLDGASGGSVRVPSSPVCLPPAARNALAAHAASCEHQAEEKRNAGARSSDSPARPLLESRPLEPPAQLSMRSQASATAYRSPGRFAALVCLGPAVAGRPGPLGAGLCSGVGRDTWGRFAIGLICLVGGPGEAEWLQTITPGDRGERLTLAWRPDRRSYRTTASFVLVVCRAPVARACRAAWAVAAVLGQALGERAGSRRPGRGGAQLDQRWPWESSCSPAGCPFGPPGAVRCGE
ncbi:hypothetical protein NDU88_005803 [Pleurodeles waltl]|uniref:Uncharacterized protein n=1 Tax=Pleurodeles waltl TaxID=8319 RepID=A0AAV7TD99_PLEWA|nr:hypothetical protein NDU88_005803 [Pleurodeles waltl]